MHCAGAVPLLTTRPSLSIWKNCDALAASQGASTIGWYATLELTAVAHRPELTCTSGAPAAGASQRQTASEADRAALEPAPLAVGHGRAVSWPGAPGAAAAAAAANAATSSGARGILAV